MSKGRMEDLLATLQESGWRLLDSGEYSRGNEDPFVLEYETIRWGLKSEEGHLLELEFHAFADLGQPTDSLRDISYCIDLRSGDKLYFDKRESPEWKAKMPEFVRLATHRAVESTAGNEGD